VTVESRPGHAAPITILVNDESVQLPAGGRHEFTLVRP
jgi:hypothetical protein